MRRRLVVVAAVIFVLLVPGAAAASSVVTTPTIGRISAVFLVPEGHDLGSGYTVWGCHLRVRAPLNNLGSGRYSYDWAEYSGDYWFRAGVRVALPTGATRIIFTSTGVWKPSEPIYGVRLYLFKGRTQVAQRQVLLTPPLVCPSRTA
jgi:hypothetical protein